MMENIDIFIWLALFLAFIVGEIISLGITSIWFAGGAFLALIVALSGGPIWLQIVVFVIASVLLLVLTRPIALKYFNNRMAKTNVENMTGKMGIVTVEVDNLRGTGTIVIDGLEWTARAAKDDVKIDKDAKVKVIRIEGVKAIVEKVL